MARKSSSTQRPRTTRSGSQRRRNHTGRSAASGQTGSPANRDNRFDRIDPELQRQYAAEGGRSSHRGSSSSRGRSSSERDWQPSGSNPERGRDRDDWAMRPQYDDESRGYQGGSFRDDEGRFSSRADDRERSVSPRGGGRPHDSSGRGFAAMDPERRRELASRGGRSSHVSDYDSSRESRGGFDREFDERRRAESYDSYSDAYRGSSSRDRDAEDWGNTGRNEQFDPYQASNRREGDAYDTRRGDYEERNRNYGNYAGESGRFSGRGIRQDEDYEERGDEYLADRGATSRDDERYYAGRGQRQENESRNSGRSRPGTSRGRTAGSRSRSHSRA